MNNIKASLSNFDVVSFIQKKQQKKALTQTEIETFVNLVKKKFVPDYQISAWLMAVSINGMDANETYYLTQSMLNSGKVYELPAINRIIIDKHSTGGVGDKVSLILLPILVACGLGVAKLSGKGLGYTGGTIDKLAAIGVKTDLSFTEALQQFKKDYIFVMEQTSDIAPVDKIFYALRDVTSTVQSIPLIASSIMSKKMALKTDYLFLDVKYGSGAFCKTIEEAQVLAHAMDQIAQLAKVNLYLHLTSMQQPLGRGVGNLIELKEAHQFLNNEVVASDLKEIIVHFAIDILSTTKIVMNKTEALNLIQTVIKNQSAFNVMTKWLISGGANEEIWKSNQFFHPQYQKELRAQTSGYLSFCSIADIGRISSQLGAGRMKKEDVIDYQAGIWFDKKMGDKIEPNDLICTLYSSNPISETIVENLQAQLLITPEQIQLEPLVIKYEK